MIPFQPKHLALAPVYLYQGLKLKKTALRLPEAEGDRSGRVEIDTPDSNPKAETSLTLMLVGDSSAAGVGVSSQQQALAGHLLNELQSLPTIQQKFSAIDWALHATSGHTSFDALRRLYVLPKPASAVDIIVVMVGVNDTTSNVSLPKWQAQLHEIIRLGKRKFGAKYIIFPCLPPMQDMPAIPSPLNKLLGYKTQLMNDKLIQVCSEHEQVIALPFELTDKSLTAAQLFAEDGFHPNSKAYLIIATKLAKTIADLV